MKRRTVISILPIISLSIIPRVEAQELATPFELGPAQDQIVQVIQEFVLNWDAYSKNVVKMPIEEILWSPLKATFLQELMLAATFRNFSLIWSMFVFASDPLAKFLALLLIIRRPVDHGVVLRWENGIVEFKRQLNPTKIKELDFIFESTKNAPRKIIQAVRDLYGLKQPI